MDNLTMAAQAGNIDRLYELIAENPTILAQIDEIPFVNTPFHTAAEAGCTHFAIEIMSLMPSFARKLNPDGLSPLDLALRKGHDELVKRLIEIDSELIRVKGKERWTPLHYVAKMDNIDLLADFLFACPLSINDVTIRKENALHIAAANGKIRALEVLMGWIERTDSQHVLSRKDEKGNTLLHVVASNSVLYGGGLRDILVKLKKEIGGAAERNSDGLKAFDIISQSQLPHQLKEAAKRVLKSWQSDSSVDSFSKFLRSEILVSEMLIKNYFRIKWSLTPEKVNCILVVVTLVVTASYQAVVQPPTANGLNGDCSINSCNITATFIENNNSTIPVQNQRDMLSAFYTLHSLVFTIGVSIIIVVIELSFVTCLVHLTLFFLHLNYILLLSGQDIDKFTSHFTTFTFVLSYMILKLKLVNYMISFYRWDLFHVEPYYKYIVKIQSRMTSSKYHGLVD